MELPFVISFIVGTYYFVKTKIKLNKVTTIFNVFAGTFLAVILISAATYNIENIDSFGSELITSNTSLSTADATIETFPPIQGEIKNYPDVYFIILDGHMSSSSLKKFLGYDNQEFVSYLTNKGFNVNHKSYSNYDKTIPSITSTMNMMYLNSLTEEQVGNLWLKDEMLVKSTVLQNFKSAGYKNIILHRAVSIFNDSPLSDLEMCKRSKFTNSQLLSLTIRTSIFGFLLEKWELQQWREATLCNFSELQKQHQKFDEPIFVFSHILVPHPPYLFSPEGEPVSSIRPQGLEDWDYKEGYINSVKFANKKIMEVVDELLSDPENQPVIIIQADHGSYFDFDAGKPSKENIEQHMSILSAYYLPNVEENLSDGVITPVNTFRTVFNSYFNTDYDLLENKMYWKDYDMPDYFVDVTNVLIQP